MLSKSYPKWWNPPSWSSRGARPARGIARAYEAEQLRRGDELTLPIFPDTDGREYWNSLNADDSNAPTGEIWRACVENESAVSSLPVSYDGTWRCG
jgi:hypothetical protein